MNNPIEGLEGLPDAQKNALMTQIEEMQVRDRYASLQVCALGRQREMEHSILRIDGCSLRMYNNVVERCFRDCVESFRRKDLESSEERVSNA